LIGRSPFSGCIGFTHGAGSAREKRDREIMYLAARRSIPNWASFPRSHSLGSLQSMTGDCPFEMVKKYLSANEILLILLWKID